VDIAKTRTISCCWRSCFPHWFPAGSTVIHIYCSGWTATSIHIYCCGWTGTSHHSWRKSTRNNSTTAPRWNFKLRCAILVRCAVLISVFAAFLDITPSRVACLVIGNSSTRKKRTSVAITRTQFTSWKASVSRDKTPNSHLALRRLVSTFSNVSEQTFPAIVSQCSYEQHKPRDGVQRRQRFGSFSFTLARTVLIGTYSANSGRRKCLYNQSEMQIWREMIPSVRSPLWTIASLGEVRDVSSKFLQEEFIVGCESNVPIESKRMIQVEIGEAVHSGTVTINIPAEETYCGRSRTRLTIPYQSRHEIRISEKATSISDAFTRYDWDVWIFLHVLLPHDLNWFSGGKHCLSRGTIIRKRLDWVQFLQNDGWIVSIGKSHTPEVEFRWRSTNIQHSE